jgi:uncharacterized C2H2 Zn-finger protein
VYGCLRADSLSDFLALDKHIREEHIAHGIALSEAEGSHTCRVHDCERIYKKTNKKGYFKHLSRAHGISDPIELHDFEKIEKGHPCYVEMCTSTVRFLNARDYDAHLTQSHQLFEAQVRRTYLKGTIERWIETLAKVVYTTRFGSTHEAML